MYIYITILIWPNIIVHGLTAIFQRNCSNCDKSMKFGM